MPNVSRLDKLYRKITFSKFFSRGWGTTDDLLKLLSFRKIMSNRDACYKLVPVDLPVSIIKKEIRGDCRIIEGKFKTPLVNYLPDLIPKEVSDAYFQMILPLEWPTKHKPICIHLAGTGDHYFWRRRNALAKPLLKHGIGAIILENPYYGLRKPSSQVRSNLHYVSDIFVMGGCLILECIALLNWCERMGYGPLGVSGLSMGGHMASLAAANWPKPLVLVPCLSWSTASSVFTEGVMSQAIDWNILQNQYLSFKVYNEVLSKTCRIVDCPFSSLTIGNLPSDTSTSQLDQFVNLNGIDIVTPYDIVTFLHKNKLPNLPSTSEVLTNYALPQNSPSSVNVVNNLEHIENGSTQNQKHLEALWFMRGIMDEFTHLKNFSVPYDPSLIIAVCAKSDAYVPRKGITKLEELWPGCDIRYLDAGHITAILWHTDVFRQSIVDGFKKAIKYSFL